MSRKNLFIAFEGIDGSGKSTQVRLLSDRLMQKGHKVHTTFEPTNSRIGTMIRDIFSHKMEGDHRTIAGLFVADRLDHLLDSQTGMLKMLDDGYNVITDRYYFSSYAYHGTHMSMDWVIDANAMSAALLRPDINIFIDVAPEVSIERIRQSRESIEMYETLENLKAVRNKYMEAFEKLSAVEKVCMIDGNRNQTSIAEDVLKCVEAIGI
jgi:dTMP kinase